MSFVSKSRFVSACVRCNKYAWLDANMPEKKAPVDEFTQSLFDNGYKVGQLAKLYFHVDVDVTVTNEDGTPNLQEMLRATQKHMNLGTGVIAEASFRYNGCFCSADILVRNPDGTYDLFEVKSSKQEKATKKNPLGVKDKYILDAAYQRYVLENCGVNINKVFVVMLARDYIRGSSLDLDQYFVKCDVTVDTAVRQVAVIAKLAELLPILDDPAEPASIICKNCNKCEYFAYCSKNIPSPSPFDVYDLDFPMKCRYYNDGVAFVDIPKVNLKLKEAARRQIEYYDRSGDTHVDKVAVRSFLDSICFPLYSLDFETYQAVVPEHPGMKTYEQLPFQYSVHKLPSLDADLADVEEAHFLDLTGGDPRRAIAESLVKHIPYGASVVAYHKSTEENIVKCLAWQFSDLADHLLSFTYCDPLKLFEDGCYYTSAMGKSFSLKSVTPALFPLDPSMDYHNLEGNVKNGTQAMNAILKVKELSSDELEQLRQDLQTYCALDTLAVVKILKKLYETSR